MAKKSQSRRVPRTAEGRMYGDGRPSQANVPQAAPAAARSTPSAQPVTRQAGMTRTAPAPADYRYVTHDLRRLGLTAAAMFALMIVLGLIIR